MTHFKSCTSKMNTVWARLDNVYGNTILSHKMTIYGSDTGLGFSQKQILYNSISAFRPFLWKGINQAYKLLY